MAVTPYLPLSDNIPFTQGSGPPTVPPTNPAFGAFYADISGTGLWYWDPANGQWIDIAEQRYNILIGQDGPHQAPFVKDALEAFPSDGVVFYLAATTALNGGSDVDDVAFEVFDQTGTVLGTGTIPFSAPATGTALVNIGPIAVVAGDAHGARIATPYPSVPGEGLYVTGIFVA